MVAYLDSSVALRHILKGETDIRLAFEGKKVYSSELFEIECKRVIHRCRLAGDLDDEKLIVAMKRLHDLLAGMNLLSLTASVKKRAAEAFPVTIKTLDALHLATALKLEERFSGEQVIIYSHNRAMNLCAKALGFEAGLG